MAISEKKILIATSAPTFKTRTGYSSYAPYVKEVDLWSHKFRDVEIISPVQYPSSLFLQEFERKDLKLNAIPFLDFRGLKKSFYSSLKIPVVLFKLLISFVPADHIHLRCPGNVGLLACLVQIFFPWKPKSAKYAGNWNPDAKQPWSYNLQKWILSNSFLTRNMQVLVYGDWQGQSRNVRPFFTASFSEREVREVREKNFEGPLTFLFVGNLVEGKRPLKAIKLTQDLQKHSTTDTGIYDERWLSLEIYGDGPEKERLENYTRDNGLEELVSFNGNRSLGELKDAYQKAHFVILPSKSEGWPKALAEGMFFGCIPIASPVSCVPWMLGEGSRGVLLKKVSQQPEKSGERKEERGKKPSDQEKIFNLLTDPGEMKKKSEAAKEWSQQYTLEKFEAAIQNILFSPRQAQRKIANRKQKT